MSVLSEAEIARMLAAYRQAGQEAADQADRESWAIARRLVAVALGTALGAENCSRCAGATWSCSRAAYISARPSSAAASGRRSRAPRGG